VLEQPASDCGATAVTSSESAFSCQAALYLSMISAGTRPRLDSSMPLELAHLRTALVSICPAPPDDPLELLLRLRPAIL
jgi:hypothetical protein